MDVTSDHPPNTDAPAPRSARILLVDDEPSFRAVVEEILRLHGHTVVCASRVTEALEAMRRNVPDVILTDVMMPEIDGLSFVRTIRSSPAWADIPVVVLTARTSLSAQSDAFLAGASTLLTKPFSASELRQAIAVFLDPAVA